MDHTPIIKMLASYLEKETVSFHMPGHTNGELFSEWLHENALAIDTTELDITDDLNNPQSAVRDAYSRAAEAFGAKETIFITTGATTAICASILYCTKKKDKIILFRNVHKSVLNACMLFDLLPVFTTESELKETLALNPDAVLVLMTRPDYYGRCADITKISFSVHDAGMLLIVDEAHGTHFAFCPSLLPVSAVTHGADIVIHSAHKTAPALTQAAFIHISRAAAEKRGLTSETLRDAVSIVSTSSPSFLIAATCDFARAYLQEFGNAASIELFSNLKYFYSLLSPELLKCIERDDYPGSGVTYDPFRLVMKISGLPFTSREIADELANKGIFIEFWDLTKIVLICKFGTTQDDFIFLAQELNRFSERKKDEASAIKISTRNIMDAISEIESLDLKYQDTFKHFPERSLSPVCGLTMKNFAKYIPLSNSAHMTLLKAVVPYPPGVPLLWPGEIMDEGTIHLIGGLLKYRMQINGVKIIEDKSSGGMTPHICCLDDSFHQLF